MELGLLATIAYLGSKNNKDKNNKNYSNIKSHDINLKYSNDRSDVNKNIIENVAKERFNKSFDPKNTNIFNNKIKNHSELNKISLNKMSSNNKIMDNNNFYSKNVKNLDDKNLFESFNGSLSNLDGNMSFNDQFKPLLFDNKGEAKPKNIAHKSTDINKITSIERSLAIDGGWSAFQNSNNDMTLGVESIDKMTHNNMVPHFKSNGSMINNYNEQNIAHRVELFSGSSKNFNPKKEVLQEKFKPMEANTGLDQESFIDKVEGYYLPSKERRNEKPFESEKIAPGLNLDPSQTHRADGGLHDEYRPLPKGINELRSADNPKTSFKSVIVPGKKGTKERLIGKTFKRRPEKTKEMTTDNYQKSGGAFRKPTSRDKIIIKNKKLKSKPFFGPATYEVNKIISQREKGKVQKSKKQQLKNKDPSNLKYHISKNNQNLKSYNLPETERESTQDNEHPQGLHRSDYGHLAYNPNDAAKQTIKQTTIYNQQSGIAKGQSNKTKSFNPKDIARPTTKQVSIHNNDYGNFGSGNIKKVSSYNPKDNTKPTHRQTTMYNDYNGGVQRHVKSTSSHNPNEKLRPTIRETSAYNNTEGNIGRSDTNKIYAYDPTQELNTTQRETTQFSNYEGGLSGPVNKGESYNPSNVPGPTIRDTTGKNRDISNLSGPTNRGQAYDPNDITSVTNRQSMSQTSQILNTRSSIDKVRTYDPSQVPSNTMKDLTIHNKNPTNAKGSNSYPHHYNPNDLPSATMRQQTSHTSYDGGFQGTNTKGISYNPNDIARIGGNEDLIHDQHTGTGRGQIDKPHYYNPSDEAKTTIKQTTLYNDNGGNIKSAYNKPNAFNPNDIPATTLKDMLVNQYNVGIAHGVINKTTAFNPNDIPADTLKQLLVINNYYSNVNKESGTGYLSNKFTVPETLRQLTNILRSGGLKGTNMPSDYSAEKNMQQDIRREMINKSREPTNRGLDQAPNKASVGSARFRDPINLERDPIRNSGNHIGNNFNIPASQTRNNFRNEESNRLNPEILTQLIDNPLVNNVVNRPDDD